MNTGDPWPDPYEAEARVLEIQAKLHQWASNDPGRCFDDLYNLVCDPAFLVVAWERVRGNKGARSAGVDGVKPRSIVFGAGTLLTGLQAELKARTFRPLPVRERMIPKASGKLRGLGIPTARDRIVQASLKLVLEPILEADFKPCSYGFRPRRRTQDAIAEIHFFGVHLPVEEVPREHRRQGADDHKAGDEQLAGRTSGPAEPGPAGLDQLLPAWSVQGDLQLPASLCMAQGGELASPQAPACQLEVAPRSLPTQVVADGGWGQDVRPIGGDGEPLPLPGRSHPLALERAHGSWDS